MTAQDFLCKAERTTQGTMRTTKTHKKEVCAFLGSVLCLLCTFPDLLGKAATLLKNVLQRELHNPRIQRISDLPESVDGQAESEYRSSSRDECRTKTVGHVVGFNTNFQSPSF